MDKKETVFEVKVKCDAPLGVWYECKKCNKQSFIPDYDMNSNGTEVFIYCPYCGKKIINI